MPRLLVDTAVLSGHANALPLHWLDGFELLPFAPRELTAHTARVHDADALLLRTATRVGAELVSALPRLRSVATLSSGTDHVDAAALANHNVALHTGHGGNARAVADWVLWALRRLPPQNPRVLVVGVGAVGTAATKLLLENGFQVTACDPPRGEREGAFSKLTLDEALRDGPWGAVSLHVPKVENGPHATTNLLSFSRLQHLTDAVVLNAARGGVLDEGAAAALRRSGQLRGLAVDTFEGEPKPRTELLETADLVTPHIAGHSIEGKLDVAHRAVTGLRTAFALPPSGTLEDAIAAVVDALAAQDLSPFAALDAAHHALKRAPADFEAIRHGHRRVEHFLR